MTTEHVLNLFAPGIRLMHEIADVEDGFSSVQWSPDGKLLALATAQGGPVCLWDATTHQKQWLDIGYTGGAADITWSPDSQMIASGTLDGTLILQDVVQKVTLSQSLVRPESLVWSGDGRHLACGYHGGACLLDVAALRLQRGMPGATTTKYSKGWEWLSPESVEISLRWLKGMHDAAGLSFSPDSKLLALTTIRGAVVWDIEADQKIMDLEGHTGPKTCVTWSRDGTLIAVGGYASYISVWSASTGELEQELFEPQGMILNAQFSPDNRRLAAVSTDNIIRMWNRADWRLAVQIPELTGGTTRALDFHSTQPLFAAGGQGGQLVRIWEYRS